jgi:NAD(P)-dependent dehydrogenase (short-subunit alcohol dehydrogenase family)
MSRVVVVTGESAGVGRATARAFGRRGDRVALLARGEEGLRDACQEVESAGGTALGIAVDVADAERVEAAAQRAEQELGPIDVWVNDAMTTIFAPFHEISPEDYKRATEVTYLGYVWGTMAALKRMRPRNRGSIVQVSSALAYRAIPLQSPYCGAKHAVRGFTDSIRSELMHDGLNVHLSAVNLPAVNTPQFDWCKSKMPHRAQPVPPIYQPEVIARAVYFAAHSRRREVTVGWPAVKVIWGNKFFPALGDWYLARTGYKSQQTDEPRRPDRPSNLYKPVAGDHGAHGRFDPRATDWSAQSWLNMHRGWVAAGALAGLVLAGAIKKGAKR